MYCDCIHHLHRFTEDEDKVLIHYQRRGDKEKVGEGQMKEGNRAQQVCCGDEGHVRLARLKKSGGIDIEELRLSLESSSGYSYLSVVCPGSRLAGPRQRALTPQPLNPTKPVVAILAPRCSLQQRPMRSFSVCRRLTRPTPPTSTNRGISNIGSAASRHIFRRPTKPMIQPG